MIEIKIGKKELEIEVADVLGQEIFKQFPELSDEYEINIK